MFLIHFYYKYRIIQNDSLYLCTHIHVTIFYWLL